MWHKKVLYRIPWDECEISIQVAKCNLGLKGSQDGYQLTLWLNPKHAVNKDLTGQKHVPLNMFHNMEHHTPLYAYWEYVRRYMTGDKPIYIEMSKEARKPGFNIEMAKREGYPKTIFMFITMLPFAVLFKPEKIALLTPFKEKWPKEVHEWTGERCDWHYARYSLINITSQLVFTLAGFFMPVHQTVMASLYPEVRIIKCTDVPFHKRGDK